MADLRRKSQEAAQRVMGGKKPAPTPATTTRAVKNASSGWINNGETRSSPAAT